MIVESLHTATGRKRRLGDVSIRTRQRFVERTGTKKLIRMPDRHSTHLGDVFKYRRARLAAEESTGKRRPNGPWRLRNADSILDYLDGVVHTNGSETGSDPIFPEGFVIRTDSPFTVEDRIGIVAPLERFELPTSSSEAKRSVR